MAVQVETREVGCYIQCDAGDFHCSVTAPTADGCSMAELAAERVGFVHVSHGLLAGWLCPSCHRRHTARLASDAMVQRKVAV